MRKQEREALRRLEEALLAAEPEPAPMPEEEEIWDEDAFLEDIRQLINEPADPGTHYFDTDYTVSNTDQADVDLEEYSEEVYQGPKGNPLSMVMIVLTIMLLCAGIFYFLIFLGVIQWPL